MSNLWNYFAYRDDILSVNQWGLTSNGWFGLLWYLGEYRPAYHVFREYADVFAPEGVEGRGNASTTSVLRLNYTATADQYLTVASTGAVKAQSGVLPLSALAVYATNSKVIKLVLLNRHYSEEVRVTVNLTNFVPSDLTPGASYIASVSSKLLYADNIWSCWNISLIPEPESTIVGWTNFSAPATFPLNSIPISLPKHSLTSVRITFTAAAPGTAFAPRFAPVAPVSPSTTKAPSTPVAQSTGIRICVTLIPIMLLVALGLSLH